MPTKVPTESFPLLRDMGPMDHMSGKPRASGNSKFEINFYTMTKSYQYLITHNSAKLKNFAYTQYTQFPLNLVDYVQYPRLPPQIQYNIPSSEE